MLSAFFFFFAPNVGKWKIRSKIFGNECFGYVVLGIYVLILLFFCVFIFAVTIGGLVVKVMLLIDMEVFVLEELFLSIFYTVCFLVVK